MDILSKIDKIVAGLNKPSQVSNLVEPAEPVEPESNSEPQNEASVSECLENLVSLTESLVELSKLGEDSEEQLDEGVISRTLGTLRMQIGNALFSAVNYGAIRKRINSLPDPNEQRKAMQALNSLRQQAKDVMISLQQLLLAVEDI